MARSEPAAAHYSATRNGLYGAAVLPAFNPAGALQATDVPISAPGDPALSRLAYGVEYFISAVVLDIATGATSPVQTVAVATLNHTPDPPYETFRRAPYPQIIRAVTDGTAAVTIFDGALVKPVLDGTYATGSLRTVLESRGGDDPPFDWSFQQWTLRTRFRSAAPWGALSPREQNTAIIAVSLNGAYSSLLTQDEATGDWIFQGGARWPAASNGIFDSLWHELKADKDAGIGKNVRISVDGETVGETPLPSSDTQVEGSLELYGGWAQVIDPQIVFSYGGQAPGGIEPPDDPELFSVLVRSPPHLPVGPQGFEVAADLGWSVAEVLTARTQNLIQDTTEFDWTANNVERTGRYQFVQSRSVARSNADVIPGTHFIYLCSVSDHTRGEALSAPVTLGPLVTEGVEAALLPSVGPVYQTIDGETPGGEDAGQELTNTTLYRYVDAPGLSNGGRYFGRGVYTGVALGLNALATGGGTAALAGGHLGETLSPGFSAHDIAALPSSFPLIPGGTALATLSNMHPGDSYELYSFGESLEAGGTDGPPSVAGVLDRRIVAPPDNCIYAADLLVEQSVENGSTNVLTAQLVPTQTPEGYTELAHYRATLVTVSSNVDLGEDPLGKLLQLYELFSDTTSVSRNDVS
jgi:hypothetical protein